MKLNIQYFAYGGKLIIDIDADAKKFEDKIEKLKAKQDREQIDLEVKQTALDNAREKVEELNNEYNKQKPIIAETNKELQKQIDEYNELLKLINSDTAVTQDQYKRFADLDNSIAGIKNKQEGLNKITESYTNKIGKAEEKVNRAEAAYQKQIIKMKETTSQMEKANGKLEEIKSKANTIDFSNIKESIDNVGKGTEKTIKKVGRWALAIFGIRSAYMLVRQAMSTISQYDKQLAADIEYIRYALAMSLKPVIEWIINLVKKLMYYIGYIANAWFGVNIWANASAKGMKKAEGSAKKLQKTLASFDEMNVLSDNSNKDGGAATPSFDLSNPKDYDAPRWLKWIAKNGDLIIAILAGIAAGLIALKLGFTGIKALGIGIAVAGIVYAIRKLLDFIKDPTFNNFIGILEGIAVAVIGIGIAFASLPVAIGGAIAFVVLLIVHNLDRIKKLFQKGINWLDTNILGGLRKLFGPIGDIMYLPIKYFAEAARNIFETFYGGIKKVIDGVMKIFKGEFLEGIKEIFGGLIDIMTAPLQGFIKAVKAVWGQIKESLNYWKQMFKGVVDYIKGLFTGLWDKISGVVDKIKGAVNWIGDKLGSAKDKVGNFFSKVGSGVKDFFGFRKGGIIVPKLASGGIINQPGRGVPLASAIGGESGAEGVVPLTDSQQMELLGEAIGRYITVNLTNVTELDGRTIARKITEVNGNTDFLMNR